MTAIITPFGLFEFLSMTFGLPNAAQTIQRFIHDATHVLPFVFLTMNNNTSNTSRFYFSDFRILDGSINPTKSHFGVTEVKFLGYTFRQHRTKHFPEEVRAILDFPKPETIRKLRGFLGMIIFYIAKTTHLV